LQERISEIKKLDGEVIAFATRGNKYDVESTKSEKRITFTLIPTPNRSVTDDFGIRKGGEGIIIIDKKGRIRYKRVNFSHGSSSIVIRELGGV
jgi:peroxiredoxin